MKSRKAMQSIPQLALLVALALAWQAAVQASPASPAWPYAHNLSQLPGRSIQQSTASHPVSGDILVAWTDNGVAEWEEVLLKRYNAAARQWEPVVNLSADGATSARDGGPVIVVDNRGVVLVIWTRTYSAESGAPSDGNQVVWRAWDGGWSSEQVLMTGQPYLTGSPGTYGLIPVETPAGILLFITWDKGYRLASFNHGAWSEPSPWAELDVELAQVVMAADGTLHAAAFGPNSRSDNPWYDDAYYLSSDTGFTWSEEVNLSFVDGVASSTSLAFDGQGRLHFLWSDPDYFASDESEKSAIWERVFSDGTWGPNVEISSGRPAQAINGISLVADTAGALHLGWSEGTISGLEHVDLDIYYREGSGESWGPEESVYVSSEQSRYPLISVADGTPYLVWQEIWTGETAMPEHEILIAVRHFATYLPVIQR